MKAPRQRVSGRLLLVANLVAANAAAAMTVVTFLKRDVFGPLPPESPERSAILRLDTPLAYGILVASAGLLFWNFAWLVRRPERLPPSNWVVSETPSGPVRVSREALEVGLRLAGEALPEVTRLRVQVDTSVQKRILVTGQFQCAEGQSNLAASQRLRQAMMDRFGELVRPADGGRVEFDLEFQGFVGKLGKKGEVPPPPNDQAPFTGPKYPIDDDTNLGGTP